MVTPRYLFPTEDGTHLTARSQHIMGELYAKAYTAQFAGSGWKALEPTAVTISGNIVTVTFNVPVGTLTRDPAYMNNLWGVGTPSTGYPNEGFSYTDNSNPPAITSVAVGVPASNQVQIALSAAPTAATGSRVLSYGISSPGFGLPPGGNLRDSDSTPAGVACGATMLNGNFCSSVDNDVKGPTTLEDWAVDFQWAF